VHEAVFFDLDGTLADTAPDLGGALNALRAERGLAALEMSVLRPHVSAGTRGMLGAGFGLKPEDAGYAPLAERFLQHYEQRLCVGTRLFSGIASLLDRLEALGIAWGIVTNKPQRFTVPLVEALGLTARSAATVSGDSAAKPKPAPDTLLLAARLAAVPPANAIYVGDDLRDIQAARAAGMRAIAAAWGYLGDGPGIAKWNADFIADHPHDILAQLVTS
jgi:phosphoglycolate phosphatase